MKLSQFESLAPSCIVCDSKMKRSIVPEPVNKPSFSKTKSSFSSASNEKYYSVGMCCTRNDACFGYVSNVVSRHDPIEVRSFYFSFPGITVYSVVGEHTHIMSGRNSMMVSYIPFDIWLKSKGQIRERLDKYLLLADGKNG